jgi:hypothetical protein
VNSPSLSREQQAVLGVIRINKKAFLLMEVFDFRAASALFILTFGGGGVILL